MAPNLQHESIKKALIKNMHILWWDWLGYMERLTLKLKEQEDLLVQGDFKSSEKLQTQLNQIQSNNEEVFEKIRVNLKKLSDIYKCEPFIEDVLTYLDEKESEKLDQLIRRIKIVSQNFNHQLKFNKAIIQNEITFLAGLKMIMFSSGTKGNTPYHPSVSTPVVMDQQT